MHLTSIWDITLAETASRGNSPRGHMPPSIELENEAAPGEAPRGVRVSRSGIGHILERETPPRQKTFRLHPEEENPAENCQGSDPVVARKPGH